MANNNFSQQMKSVLNGYSDALCRAMEEVIEEAASISAEKLKQTSPKRKKGGGAYARSWTSDVTKGRTYTKGEVHNRKHYQLTHLLENGHANRGGGRTQPYVHIAPVEAEAVTFVEQKIKEKIRERSY